MCFDVSFAFQAAFFQESRTALFYFRTPDHVENLFTDLPDAERRERLRVYEVGGAPASARAGAGTRAVIRVEAAHPCFGVWVGWGMPSDR